jgi:DNA repair exonuclease SbcCD ATPase subunit
MTAPDLTPVPLSPERLAEIREREQAATSGPWGTYFDRVVYDVVADLQPTGSGYRCRRQIAELRDEPIDNDPAHRDWTAEEDASQILHDATFITRAREDVPALLAEVDRLTAERDKLAHELDGASLSLWEEEQENARLRLAYRSARERAVASSETILRVVGDRESYQGWLKAAEAELAQWQATFGRDALPGALDRLHQAESEVDRLSKRVAELETAHAPRLCACGHSLPAHTAPEPHSCFAHGQTCTCPTYRQLPPAEAWAQLEKNIRASEVHAAEQAAAVGAEGGTS